MDTNWIRVGTAFVVMSMVGLCAAHPGEDADLHERHERVPLLALDQEAQPTTRPVAAAPFVAFAPGVATRWDDRFLYIESNGMPDHAMMIGIRAWQQQVPLPQPYTADNAWRIPLVPVPAKEPISARDGLFRGAIAIAANGVPIFNPIKNDGKTDTFLAGELDEFGGHSGRADDYHYHIAPLHIQKVLGDSLPIAYALDGYPIYGLLGTDPCKIAGTTPLDAFNGHADANGLQYHYHASKTYPYVNGGLHGQVEVRDGQIDPQPRATPVREATRPLRGANIVDFTTLASNSWQLSYTIGDDRYTLKYRIDDQRNVIFETTSPDGTTQTKTYRQRRDGPDDKNAPPPRDDKTPQDGAQKPPRKPWIIVHAPEMDANKDGILTRPELDHEIDETFKGYDLNNDGIVSREETKEPVRSALGGFVKQHFDEFRKGESFTLEDLRRSVGRMFDKADKSNDGQLSGDELADPNR